MNIFSDGGHLTEEALRGLAEGAPLPELERLEIAEHLAFCDRCLQRYTDLLSGAELSAPAANCRAGVLWRIRRRTARIFASRYATAAAAVALALSVVWGGVRLPSLPERNWNAPEERWAERWDGGRAFSQIQEFFDGLGEALQGGNP